MAGVRLAVGFERLTGVIAQDLHCAARLANALGERLALLTGEVAADIGGTRLEQVRGFAQDVTTAWGWHRPPGRERVAGGFDCLSGQSSVCL